jgi:DNA-binding response OmpR family regulator
VKILLLEDDVLLHEIIQEHLEASHEIISFFDGEDAQSYMYSHKVDLFLLDVNVPKINGFDLVKDLRNNNIHTPVIFITSLDMIEDIEKGFNVGCDDYLKKPFELKELDLRINNIKRLFKIEEKDLIPLFEQCHFYPKKLSITKNNRSYMITSKESEVLHYLVNNSHKIVSIEELINNIWPYEESPLSSTIRTYVKNLRKILGEDKIINVRGVGYRFNQQ